MGWKNISGFVRDESGAALIYVGLAMSSIISFAGLAIDVGHWYSTQQSVQAAADSAAVAGAYEAKFGGDAAAIENAAVVQAGRNGFAPETVTVNTSYSHVNGSETTTAVEVIIQQPTAGFFSSVVMQGAGVDVAARSVSGSVGGEPICFLLLDPSARKALELTGGSSIEANGCVVQVNSSHSQAIKTSGGASVTAESIDVVGGVSDPGAMSPTANTGMPVFADPLASMSPPTYDPSDCMPSNNFNSDQTLDPGVYCGGLRISNGANITFNPGIYIIQDGRLRASGGSDLHGDGVGFYMTGSDAYVDLSGGGTIHLTAPVSGEMAGLVFFQGPDAPAGETNEFSGGTDAWYEGALYFPDQEIEMTGGSTTTVPPHTTIIANNLKISGGGVLTIGSDFASSSVPAVSGLGGQGIAILE